MLSLMMWILIYVLLFLLRAYWKLRQRYRLTEYVCCSFICCCDSRCGSERFFVSKTYRITVHITDLEMQSMFFVTLHKIAPVEKPVVTYAVFKYLSSAFSIINDWNLQQSRSDPLPTLFKLIISLFVNAQNLTLVKLYKLAFQDRPKAWHTGLRGVKLA